MYMLDILQFESLSLLTLCFSVGWIMLTPWADLENA